MPISRPRGRATPFFRLRPIQRHKGVGRFRLIHLLSIKNFTLFLIVLAFMLMWTEERGFAPSLDMAASQMFRPTTQHVFNFSDTFFSRSQHKESSNATESMEKETKFGSREAIGAQQVGGETEVNTSTSSLSESSVGGSNEDTSVYDEDKGNKSDTSQSDKKSVDENTKVGRDIQREGGDSNDVQNDAQRYVQNDAHGDAKDNAQDNAGNDAPSDSPNDTQNEESTKPKHADPSDVSDAASEAYRGSGEWKGEEKEQFREDNTEAKGKPDLVKTRKTLAEILNFTPATAINFMHFHKTGGVSFKTSLHKFYFEKFKGNGRKVHVRDACYAREGVENDPSKPSFLQWRCDWDPVREQNEEERNKLDYTFGHQFWGDGIGDLLNQRDVRSFTVMRHPFDRKVSFYFHFFVREVGRKEEDVTYEEIRDFLLFDKLIIKADLGRDLGPNYMAGRLLSNGVEGFVGNESFQYYEVEQSKKYDVAEKALKLVRDYLFVGLQVEFEATKCMLKKAVEVFNQVNGVDNSGMEVIDDGAKKLNSGSYSLNAKRIWSQFSAEEKIIFDRKERVDLLIYEEGERLFKEQVKLFGCTDRVEAEKYKS